MTMLWSATVPLEIAHLGTDGVMHGHSLTVEVWTDRPVDLLEWHALVAARTRHINGQLEVTIGGRTFEQVGAAVLAALPEAVRARVRLPTLGASIDMRPGDMQPGM